MKTLLKVAAAFVCAIGTVTSYAQMTTVTASSIKMGGVNIPAGTVTFIPTNSNLGSPVSITAGGTLFDAQGFTGTITNGAIDAGFQVPDECVAIPTIPNIQIAYQVVVLNNTSKKSFNLTRVAGVCGATWALDSYAPTQNAVVLPTGLISGSTAPAHCTNTSIFYTQSNPSSTYNCVSGVYILQSSSGGGNVDPATASSFGTVKLASGQVATTLAKVATTGAYADLSGKPVAGTDFASVASVTSAASAASAAQTTASAAIPSAQKGAASGVAALDASSRVPLANIPSLLPPVAGASAEYPFTDGTGSTLTDISGNGNNGVISSGVFAPAWYPYGLAFDDTGSYDPSKPKSVQTPLNTFRTFYVAACSPFLVQNSGTSSYGVAGSWAGFTGVNSGVTGGVNLLSNNKTGSASYQPSVGNNASGTIVTTIAPGSSFGGCHVYGFALDVTSDKITVDGVEVQSYGAHGGSSSFATASGNYLLGGATIGGTFGSMRGVLTYAMYYPTEHTVTQMQQVTQYIQGRLASRANYPKYPNLTNSIGPKAIIVGDSLTATFQGSSQWTSTIGTLNGDAVENWGIYSIFAIDQCSLAPNRWVQSIVPGRTIVQFWLGTNDMANGRTAADTYGVLLKCAATAKQHGAKVILATMISRTGQDANKNLLNAQIRGNAKNSGVVDYINDLAAVAAIGADGANTNAACFQSDHIHMTGPGAGTCATILTSALTGYGVVGNLTQNAINTMEGSSVTNPDQTTSAAYVSGYINNYVIQTPAAAATYSLVDCQGQTSPRTLVNGSATNTITVSAINSQTITGSTSVAANTTAVFMPVLTSPTTGGCSWQRIQ